MIIIRTSFRTLGGSSPVRVVDKIWLTHLLRLSNFCFLPGSLICWPGLQAWPAASSPRSGSLESASAPARHTPVTLARSPFQNLCCAFSPPRRHSGWATAAAVISSPFHLRPSRLFFESNSIAWSSVKFSTTPLSSLLPYCRLTCGSSTAVT